MGKQAHKAIILWGSVALMALGASLYFYSGMGADPVSTLCDGLFRTYGIPRGNASLYINGGIFLVFIWFSRRYAHIGSVITAFCVGPFITIWEGVLHSILRGWQPAWLGGLLLVLLASLCVAAGRALYLPCDCGAAPLDMMILQLASRTKWSYRTSFWVTSSGIFAVGLLLGGAWGFGTLVAIFLTGIIADKLMICWKPGLQRFVGLRENNSGE